MEASVENSSFLAKENKAGYDWKSDEESFRKVEKTGKVQSGPMVCGFQGGFPDTRCLSQGIPVSPGKAWLVRGVADGLAVCIASSVMGQIREIAGKDRSFRLGISPLPSVLADCPGREKGDTGPLSARKMDQ